MIKIGDQELTKLFRERRKKKAKYVLGDNNSEKKKTNKFRQGLVIAVNGRRKLEEVWISKFWM